MHPPAFHLGHRLSDWRRCWLEVRCPCSPRMVTLPVRLLLEREDRTFAAMLASLRCSKCRGNPAPVYLVAGHTRSFVRGPPPDWSVELEPRAPRT